MRAEAYRASSDRRAFVSNRLADGSAVSLAASGIGYGKMAASTTIGWAALAVGPVLAEKVSGNTPRGRVRRMAAMTLSDVANRYGTLQQSAKAVVGMTDAALAEKEVVSRCSRYAKPALAAPSLGEGFSATTVKAEVEALHVRCKAVLDARQNAANAAARLRTADAEMAQDLTTVAIQVDDAFLAVDGSFRKDAGEAFTIVLASPFQKVADMIKGDATSPYAAKEGDLDGPPLKFLVPSVDLGDSSVTRLSEEATGGENLSRAFADLKGATTDAQVRDGLADLEADMNAVYALTNEAARRLNGVADGLARLRRLADQRVLTVELKNFAQPLRWSTPEPVEPAAATPAAGSKAL